MDNEQQALPGGEMSAAADGVKGPAVHRHNLALVVAFTLTTFLSALLLFSIQPLFAKMVLPILGGAPSVWAVALCFFQGALLAGYCYAHWLNGYVPARWTGAVHLAVFCLAVTALPIGLPAAWREPPPGDPYLWQLGLFSVAVGLPFIAVSANAPLLQAWFAKTGHPDGRDPYFLYGASNLGSFIALLAYPLLLEPAFGLTSLSRQWTIGFVLLGLAIAVCYLAMRATVGEEDAAAPAVSEAAASAPDEAPTWAARLGWIGLAMVPSALLTAFTTHVATDVASAPLIWVLPLSLYLLTFVLVFRDRPLAYIPCVLAAAAAGYIGFRSGASWLSNLLAVVTGSDEMRLSISSQDWLPRIGAVVGVALFTLAYVRGLLSPVRWLLLFHLAAVILALLQLSQTRHDTWFVSAATGVAAFFLSALVAHRTLYEARPAARHLTEFYLWMSLGGVLGGLFAALLAPKLFSEVLEYPILLALTIACRPQALSIKLQDREELLKLWLIFATGVLVVWWSQLANLEDKIRDLAFWFSENVAALGIGAAVSSLLRSIAGYGIAAVLAAVFAAVLVAYIRYPVRQLTAAFLMCLAVIMLPSSVKRGDAERSYFGIYRVSESYDKEFMILTHGTTLHGAQRIRDNTGALVVDTTPGTYYHPGSPMAKGVELVRERLTEAGRKGRYGVVGLGTGSLTCFSKEGESWRIFEIDPVIVGIASDPTRFSFVSNCQPRLDVVLGDARLTMAKEPDASFDLIIVDAFSSDAIPVHLMTAEAMRLYAAKLKPDGVLLLHISNRYLDLDSVLAATMPLVPGLDGVILSDDEADGSYASTTSTAGVFSMSKDSLEAFRKLEMSREMADTPIRAWTDDYSDILAPFLSKMKR